LTANDPLPATFCCYRSARGWPGRDGVRMTTYVIFVATLISIWVIRNQGLEAAFLKVWLPFFLLFPFQFFVNLPGLPDPNFMQAAILPILFVYFMQRRHEIRFGTMEFLLLAYFVLRVFNDFLRTTPSSCFRRCSGRTCSAVI
jgi:hypothetical protein